MNYYGLDINRVRDTTIVSWDAWGIRGKQSGMMQSFMVIPSMIKKFPPLEHEYNVSISVDRIDKDFPCYNNITFQLFKYVNKLPYCVDDDYAYRIFIEDMRKVVIGEDKYAWDYVDVPEKFGLILDSLTNKEVWFTWLPLRKYEWM